MTITYGLILLYGGIQMNSKIVETLELMCDKENLQDNKILLLAELVETKCEALSKNQDGLKKSLEETNTKLDKLTGLLERYEDAIHGCPVYKNKESFEKLSFFVKYPKITTFVVMGILAFTIGFFGTKVIKFLNTLFSLL